jgi:hypothetical protein
MKQLLKHLLLYNIHSVVYILNSNYGIYKFLLDKLNNITFKFNYLLNIRMSEKVTGRYFQLYMN